MITAVVADRRLSPVLWFILSLCLLRLFLSTFQVNEGLQMHFFFFFFMNENENKNFPASHLLRKVFKGIFSSVEWWCWWPISRIRGFLGRLMVSFCMLVGGRRVRFLMCTPYRTLNRRRFGRRMIGMLLAPSVTCVFPLRLHASLPRTYDLFFFSLMSAICLCLRPSAAMTDGWCPLVRAVSSAGLRNAFLEHHDGAFLLGARLIRLFWACVRIPSLWRGKPRAAAPGAR